MSTLINITINQHFIDDSIQFLTWIPLELEPPGESLYLFWLYIRSWGKPLATSVLICSWTGDWSLDVIGRKFHQFWALKTSLHQFETGVIVDGEVHHGKWWYVFLRPLCAFPFQDVDSLVGGAITTLKNMSSSMGRMTSHIILWKIKAMFETTNQLSMCIHCLVTIFINFPYHLIAIRGLTRLVF